MVEKVTSYLHDIPEQELLASGEQEILQNIDQVVVVGGHHRNSHKLEGLHRFARDKMLVTGNNGGEVCLPLVTAGSCPTLIEEEQFNTDLSLDAGIIAALKTEQIRVRGAYNERHDESSRAHLNYLRGILKYTPVYRGLDEKQLDEVAEVMAKKSFIIVTATDVMVDARDEEGSWLPMTKIGTEIPRDHFISHLLNVLGNVRGYDEKEIRVRVGMAAKTLLYRGIPVNIGLFSEVKSFFYHKQLRQSQIEAYVDQVGRKILGSVNGGCRWAEELHPLITGVSHADRGKEDEEKERKQLRHRLKGTPPELLDLVGELVTMFAAGKKLPKGVNSQHYPGILRNIADQVRLKEGRDLNDFVDSAALWGELAGVRRRAIKFEEAMNRS